MSIPTNIADAAAAVKDGTLVPQNVMIGDVVISALIGLRAPRRKEVTRRPVQAGYSVALGVIDVPDEVEMVVVLGNPDYSPETLVTAAPTGEMSSLTDTWKEKFDTLEAYFNNKDLVDFTTHDKGYPPTFVIEEMDPLYDNEEDWEGWIGTIRLVDFGSQGASQTAVDLDDAKTAAKAYVGSF